MASDIPISSPPEDVAGFRVAQLLLVLVGIQQSVNIERLGYYDFFLSNPMLIDELEDSQRTALVMSGFDSRTINHQSAAQRFANRRQRLRGDLGTLIAYGLAEPSIANGAVEYLPTPHGRDAAEAFTTQYADGIRASISITLPQLRRLSDRALRSASGRWLRASRFNVDLLGLPNWEEVFPT